MWVHHHIREDAQTLYGFTSREERDVFETLIGTHGVGPALGLAISTTTIAYLAIFPALYILRKKLPNVHRPYRAPFGDTGAFVISALTFGWAALATAALLWPGLGQADPDSSLPSGFAPVVDSAGKVTHAAQRWQYEVSQFVPLAVIITLGVVFYALGAPTRRKEVTVPLQTAVAAD